MYGYMVVAEGADDGMFWNSPAVWDTNEEAETYAKAQPAIPKGYVWAVYRLRDRNELSI